MAYDSDEFWDEFEGTENTEGDADMKNCMTFGDSKKWDDILGNNEEDA